MAIVDFPAPVFPIIPKVCPFLMEKETLESACMFVCSYEKVISLNEMEAIACNLALELLLMDSF